MQRLISIIVVTGAVLAGVLVGGAGAANASATIDLIWADTGTNELSDVELSSAVTLQVILTTGPNGSRGAGVSVDYSGVLSSLVVIDYMSTPGGGLPIMLGTTSDTGLRVENINSASIPPHVGSGLPSAGQIHQLGTVTFQVSQLPSGTLEIRSDANGPTDGVFDFDGNTITSTTAFNSAYLSIDGTFPTPTPTAIPTPSTTPTSTPSATPTPSPPSATPTATPIATPTATPTTLPTATATAIPTPTPTAEPTPTPTAEPTPPPCSLVWPETTFVTKAKGQKPSNNAKLTHTIRGNIIEPGSLGDTAHRIPVCAGTEVTSTVTDTTGTPMNTASGSLDCSPSGCAGVVNETEKYQSRSADGKDKDSITFLPN